ncbi:hypothetical protein SBRCBS47491_001664 [Sporothrix bragantina]|uniref:Uncharacterized protein n=1 Tax=Sporothrix bragantina TaxID=671064 RepID=A0ABP0B0I2_9PEZI
MNDLGLETRGYTLKDPETRGKKDDYLMVALYIHGEGIILSSLPRMRRALASMTLSKDTAQPQSLCSTGSKIDPACNPVFTNLGVLH